MWLPEDYVYSSAKYYVLNEEKRVDYDYMEHI